jgi:hypothetical protein
MQPSPRRSDASTAIHLRQPTGNGHLEEQTEAGTVSTQNLDPGEPVGVCAGVDDACTDRERGLHPGLRDGGSRRNVVLTVRVGENPRAETEPGEGRCGPGGLLRESVGVVRHARQGPVSAAVHADLDACALQRPQPVRVQKPQLRRADRPVPGVGGTHPVGHGEGDRGNVLSRDDRKTRGEKVVVAVVEGHQHGSARDPGLPRDHAQEFVDGHEPKPEAAQQPQLPRK